MGRIDCPRCAYSVSLSTGQHVGYFVPLEFFGEGLAVDDIGAPFGPREGPSLATASYSDAFMTYAYRCPACGMIWPDPDDPGATGDGAHNALRDVAALAALDKAESRCCRAVWRHGSPVCGEPASKREVGPQGAQSVCDEHATPIDQMPPGWRHRPLVPRNPRVCPACQGRSVADCGTCNGVGYLVDRKD